MSAVETTPMHRLTVNHISGSFKHHQGRNHSRQQEPRHKCISQTRSTESALSDNQEGLILQSRKSVSPRILRRPGELVNNENDWNGTNKNNKSIEANSPPKATVQRTQSMKQPTTNNKSQQRPMRRTFTAKQQQSERVCRGASEPVSDFRERTFSSPRQYPRYREEKLVNGDLSPSKMQNGDVALWYSRQNSEKQNSDGAISPWRHKGFSPCTDMPPEDVMRMRTFTIDSKGYLINRGDSFRRRSNTAGAVVPPMSRPVVINRSTGNSTTSSSAYSSRCQSPLPLNDHLITMPPPLSTPEIPKYNILILGIENVGKTSIINQFMTSEFCTLFNSELIERSMENTISVVLDGEESELTFIEVDTSKNDLWESLSGSGYLVVYSVDDETTFKRAKEILYSLREQKHTALKPIVLVGNKADLERRRYVTTEEGKLAAKENDCKFVEVSVALGHHVDELLAGILTQIKLQNDNVVTQNGKKLKIKPKSSNSNKQNSPITCTNLSHAGRSLVNKLLKKHNSKSVEDLFQD